MNKTVETVSMHILLRVKIVERPGRKGKESKDKERKGKEGRSERTKINYDLQFDLQFLTLSPRRSIMLVNKTVRNCFALCPPIPVTW